MYFIQEVSSEIQALDVRLKELVQSILSKVQPSRPGAKLSSNLDVFGVPENRGKLFLLKEGALSYSMAGRVLYYVDSGDLIGTEQAFGHSEAKIVSDFAVVVDEYEATTLIQSIQSNQELLPLWTEYLSTQFSAISLLCASFVRTNFDRPPDIRAYRSGEIIIDEGTKASDVYTLVEGEAEAVVGGVAVGKILSGEIFGVIAALTGIPRTATVRAKIPCTILSLPRENFVQLIESRPQTFLKVVEDMARTMVSLNDKVVSLTLSKF